jgi:hypothetical protein
MEDLRYPIGKYVPQPFSPKQLQDWLIDITFLPQHLENAILNLDEEQINTPYRPQGWTVKELVHHVADSHMNAYIRFKLGLTEDNPTIKPYDEVAWATLVDSQNLAVNISLTLLHALHVRWIELLKAISTNDWNRTVYHPENKNNLSLWHLLGTYAWHSRHHVAHITSLRERMNW